MSGRGFAHEIRPSIVDVSVGGALVELSVELTLEPLIAGMDVSEISNTNESPLAKSYDRLRSLDPEGLETALRSKWPEIRDGFIFFAGETRLSADIQSVTIPDVGNLALPRDSTLKLTVELPDDGTAVRIGWDKSLGPVIIRQIGGGQNAYTAYLTDGALSEPLPRDRIEIEGVAAVVQRYTVIGFEHIVPKGLDHILFVLGLFFFSLAVRPLFFQITAFTLAHTVTLALASLSIISMPSSIVEPLIAASIVVVAVENLFGGSLTRRRLAIVFMFGLLHGLGFASVLSDIGLDPTRFIVGLISFNIGVELGQIAVVTAAFMLVGYWFGKKPWYRARIAIPVSVVIGLIGAFWVVERTLL